MCTQTRQTKNRDSYDLHYSTESIFGFDNGMINAMKIVIGYQF